MKIGMLDQHCGECGVIEYCGNPFCYCLCTDSRFADVEEDVYAKIAEHAPIIRRLGVCKGCEHPDCDDCEHCDEYQDDYCEQVADYVYGELKKAGVTDGN